MAYDLTNDRVLKYMEPYIKNFLFVEFSDEFMKKLKIDDIAKGIKVPLEPKDVKEFAGGEGISATKIAENMIFVIGCNPNFKYIEEYKKYMDRFFKDGLKVDILMAGVRFVEKKDLVKACIHFRAALALDPNMMEAMYNYARVCREIYTEVDDEDEEKIGRFKAEFIDLLEQLTIDFPDFEQPYYFLGYAYLNMGLYEKAGLIWEKFLLICKDPQVQAEIAQRLGQIAEPRKIEQGCNHVISGRYQEGLITLLQFQNSTYDTWWPLHFYLGIAYEELGNLDMAKNSYEKTLRLNAAQMEAMDGLIRIYSQQGNDEMVEKYTKKKAIVEENLKLDMEDR